MVVNALLQSNSESVLDLGCGTGQLLVRLAAEKQFQKIVGIDQSQEALAEARALLALPENAPGENRLSLYHASFTSFIEDIMVGFDAGAMVETIEHVAPQRLSAVEQTVFSCLRLKTVVVTTPNREFNALHGIPEGGFRHPDHRFEWTRAKFRSWAAGVARRNNYLIRFDDIGEFDPQHGTSTQMATFSRG
jgi:3' terminal RNA ribose 2'-O-methyltransferase Hen1